MSIEYLFKNPSIFGEKCPMCGKKSWEIFKCDKCGKVFCKYCRPDLVKIDSKTGNIDVTCECGSTTLFYD